MPPSPAQEDLDFLETSRNLELKKRELEVLKLEIELHHKGRNTDHEGKQPGGYECEFEQKQKTTKLEQNSSIENLAQLQRLDVEKQSIAAQHKELELRQKVLDLKREIQHQLDVSLLMQQPHHILFSPPPTSDPAVSPIPFDTVVQTQLDVKCAKIDSDERQLKGLYRALLDANDDLRRKKSELDKEHAVIVGQLDAERKSLEKERLEEKKKRLARASKMKALESILRSQYRKSLRSSRENVVAARAATSSLCDALNEKFALIQDRKLVGSGAQRIWDIPDQFLSAFWAIESCNKNSKHYGAADTSVDIEYRCEQLSKQIHINTKHYLDLLRFIFDTGDRKHINPHDPKVTFNAHTTLSSYWKSDTHSGKAPKFTPDLKVFFSSPCISNGDWVQFHGPGTVLYQIDPGFKLTVGSLCDPDGKGSFVSINSQDPATDPDNKYNGKSSTSPYQIKFKWE